MGGVKFAGQEIAFTGMAGQRLAKDPLRISFEIGVGRVKIVDAPLQCRIYQGKALFAVDTFVIALLHGPSGSAES